MSSAMAAFCSTSKTATRLSLIDALDDVDDLVDQHGCEPKTRLVKQQQFRLGHQRASDREHLLFAAGQVAGLGAGTLGQAGKPGERSFDEIVDMRAIAVHRGCRQKIFPRRQVHKDAAAFEYVSQTKAHPFRRIEREKIASRQT